MVQTAYPFTIMHLLSRWPGIPEYINSEVGKLGRANMGDGMGKKGPMTLNRYKCSLPEPIRLQQSCVSHYRAQLDGKYG